MSLRAGLRSAVLVALTTTATAGAAAEPDRCLSSPVQGQELRQAGKLLAARGAFLICAQRDCPTEIVDACARWRSEVESSLASVVFAAHGEDNHDLADVWVSIDRGEPVSVNPRAIELDPGTHRFVFQRAGANDVVLERTLVQGEKNRIITIVVPDRAARIPPVPTRRIPTASWIAGGIGLASLAVSGSFGGLYLARRASDGCDTGCSATKRDDIARYGAVSNVALGVGLVAAGVATWFYLTGRSTDRIIAPSPLDLRF